MTSDERGALILAYARTLFVNGQATDQTVDAAERVGRALGLNGKTLPRWGEIQFQSDSKDGTIVGQVAADPPGVDMDRVVSTMRAIEDIEAKRLTLEAGAKAINAISRKPPAPKWLFALAAAAGAVALSVIFGVEHSTAMVLIFISAGAGGFLRRALGQLTANEFIQPFCASILAGLIGGLAVRYNLSSSLRLVAVCPCMILVPGPHVLNGMMDLIAGRISLGSSRLVYASVVILAISFGLLLGLGLLGVSLPVGEPGRNVPFWVDIIAAGVAVGAYRVFYSTPWRM